MGERPTAADAAGSQQIPPQQLPQHPGFRTEPDGNTRWIGSQSQDFAVDEAGHIWRHHGEALGDQKWEYVAQKADGGPGDAGFANEPVGPTRAVGRGNQNRIDSAGNLWRWKTGDRYEFIARTVQDPGA